MMDSQILWTIFNSHNIGETVSDASYPRFKAYHFDVVERHVQIGKVFHDGIRKE